MERNYSKHKQIDFKDLTFFMVKRKFEKNWRVIIQFDGDEIGTLICTNTQWYLVSIIPMTINVFYLSVILEFVNEHLK